MRGRGPAYLSPSGRGCAGHRHWCCRRDDQSGEDVRRRARCSEQGPVCAWGFHAPGRWNSRSRYHDPRQSCLLLWECPGTPGKIYGENTARFCSEHAPGNHDRTMGVLPADRCREALQSILHPLLAWLEWASDVNCLARIQTRLWKQDLPLEYPCFWTHVTGPCLSHE